MRYFVHLCSIFSILGAANHTNNWLTPEHNLHEPLDVASITAYDRATGFPWVGATGSSLSKRPHQFELTGVKASPKPSLSGLANTYLLL
jgi:hypothetical protein